MTTDKPPLEVWTIFMQHFVDFLYKLKNVTKPYLHILTLVMILL